MEVFAAATIVCLGLLLVFEHRHHQLGVWVLKPLASTGFLATAIAAGAFESDYGVVIFVALVLSWWGDVLLIPRDNPKTFKAGLVAFLLAHIAFIVAFFLRPYDLVLLVVAALPFAVSGFFVDRWLHRKVPPKLAIPVRVYIVVVTAMAATSFGTLVPGLHAWIVLGALLFWASDLFVARQRFVTKGFVNRAVGLPLYYGAQLVFALTVSL